jgi:HEAT repeat protein
LKKFKIIKLKNTIKNSLESNLKILESGTDQKKIEILKTLNNTNNLKILQQIILRLNDDNIQVRGEAFNALLLNQNKISKILIDNLNSPNKNIKSFTSLVLANRNEKSAIPKIIEIVNNEHGMVRSCAIGSLGYLKAEKITDIILKALSDSNFEVQKSALQAAIQTKIFVPEQKIKEISKKDDSQIKHLIIKLKKISGPKGI